MSVADAKTLNGKALILKFRCPKKNMKDGLYRVVTPYLCAGFVVEDGIVKRCAPILLKKINYWITVAERIDESGIQRD